MPLLPMLELFTIFVIIFVVITQVVIPLWNDRRIFSDFRKKRSNLKDQLVCLVEEEEDQKIISKINEKRSRLSVDNNDTTTS